MSVYLFPKKGGSAFDNLPRPVIEPEWEGSVSSIQLRPAIEGVSASLKTGKNHQIHFTNSDPTAKITVEGPSGKSLSGKLIIQKLRMADTLGGNNWNADTRVTEVKRLREKSVNLNLSGGSDRISVSVPDEKNRTIGFTLLLEDGQKRWYKYLGSVSMVPPRNVGEFNPDGRFLSSYHLGIRKGKYYIRGTDLDGDVGLNGLKRMGIDWIRHANFVGTWMPEEGEVDWSESDKMYDAFRENGLLVAHAVGPVPKWMRGPGWDQGLDVNKNLKDVNFKNRTIKTDYSPRREMLPLFGKAHKMFYKRYKDVIRASNVWNEPWEGGGITGWKSTGTHYREIYREIRDAVNKADPSIKMLAADSPHNTNWKLFAAGLGDSLDAITTHYTSPSTGYSFSLANEYDTEVWETETWLAWKGDASSVRHALYYFAAGGDRVSLYNDQMFFDRDGNPTPTATWTAATRKMLEGLSFKKIVHPERPPFVLLFEGDNRHVAAVLSSMKGAKTSKQGAFRSQFLGDDVTMHLSGGDDYRVYNILGNPREQVRTGSGGERTLKVTQEPQFIEFKGSVDTFEKRLSEARYEELRPVEIFVHDMTEQVGKEASIPVELHNAYGQEISGTVRLDAENLNLDQSSKSVTLSAAQHKTIEIPVSGKTTEGNQFAVRVSVETDHGKTNVQETIHESIIARGTPEIDGDVSEWKNISKPVLLSKTGASGLQQKDWFPWKELTQIKGDFTAQFAYAADDNNLYMMARVKDGSKNILPSMLSGENLHEFQKEPYDYTYVQAGPLPGQNGDHIQLSITGPDDQPYKPKYELYPPDHPLHRFAAHLNTDYLYMIYPTKNGNTEVMRMRTPDFYFLHPFPINYEWMSKNCKVPGAKAKVKREGDGYIYEVALPWSELDEIPHQPGDRIRLNFTVQNKGKGNRLTWSAGRTAARKSGLDFEPGYGQMWDNSTWWGFIK